MTPEMKLAQQKIAELELKLKALSGADAGKLILLPNGDLHRGLQSVRSAPNLTVDETITIETHNPLNKAMAQILTAAKGGHALTCLWCGLQWDGLKAEQDIRDHLKKDHASVVEGYDAITSEVLMANLDEAKHRLAAAEAK